MTRHTCWEDPEWDGLMQYVCGGCSVARANPCGYCGYGHIFATHNPEAHYDNGDPSMPPGENDLSDEWLNGPHKKEN